MTTCIPFHLIEGDPHRSFVHWIYVFDRGGRRHVLGITRVELHAPRPHLMIRHHLVRKGLPLGLLEATSLEAASLTSPPVDLAFLDHLVDDPLQLGETIATFLDTHFHLIAALADCSVHERISMTSEFRENLAHARERRKLAATVRRKRLAATRATGIVPKVDLKDGRLVRLCPKWHQDLSADALATTYRVSRKSSRARRYSLVGVAGPWKDRRFAPPGTHQVYLTADVSTT